MKLRRIIFLLISVVLMLEKINAVENIIGSPKSQYEKKEEKIVEIKNVTSQSEFIQGSVIQIQDENGFVIYEFTTPKESYIIEGLDNGKYYLVQLSTPEGYELNLEKKEFEISDENTEVEILNNESVTLPGNMSSNSVLLISMAMLDITIIIGVIVYVKKSKIKK